jgi:hypothetical protein
MSGRRPMHTPHHYERLPLKSGVRLLLWVLAVVLVVVGIALALRSPGGLLSAAAGVLLTVGAIGLVAAYRLGCFEVLVTRPALKAGWGPFSHAYPRYAVKSVLDRPASGWRRLYSPVEAVVEFEGVSRARCVAVPSRAPEELRALLVPVEPSSPR